MSTDPPTRNRKRARSPVPIPNETVAEASHLSEVTESPQQKKRKRLSASERHAKEAAEYDPRTAAVYDSCNEVRRKIRAHIANGAKITQFLREIGNINSNSYRNFMRMTLPMQGSGNGLYPAAYYYFERRRIAEGKPKSKLRKQSEAAFPRGHSLEPTACTFLWALPDRIPVVNRLGIISDIPAPSRTMEWFQHRQPLQTVAMVHLQPRSN